MSSLNLDQGLKHPKQFHVFRNTASCCIISVLGGERMWLTLSNFGREWKFIFQRTGKRIFCLHNPKVFPAEYLLNRDMVCETQKAS